MKCKNCGADNMEGVMFCTSCGAVLSPVETQFTSLPATSAHDTPQIRQTVPFTGLPTYIDSQHTAPVTGQPAFGDFLQPSTDDLLQPPQTATTTGQPVTGQPAYAPVTGQPAYGDPRQAVPVTGQPSYGDPWRPAPVTGQPAYGDPARMAPVTGQPAYTAPIPPSRPAGSSGKNKTVTVIIAAACVLVLLIGGGIGGYAWYRSSLYGKAQAAYESGDYQEAYDLYEKLGGYRDARTRKDSSGLWLKYESAIADYEAGNLESARNAFAGLKKFEDSEKYLAMCDARALYDSGEFEAAYYAFLDLEGFADSAARAEKCIQDVPPNGLAEKGEAYQPSTDSGLQFDSYSVDAIYFKFYNQSGDYWGSVYLSANGSAAAFIPAGYYTVTGYTGTGWFGLKDLFGKDERSSQLYFDNETYWTIPEGKVVTVNVPGF